MEIKWNSLYDIYAMNPLGWNIAMGVAVLIAMAYVPNWRTDNGDWLSFVPRRRGKMLRRERLRYVQSQAVDILVSGVEERVYSGEFTREEARDIYRDFKKCFPIRDLFPSPELLKDAIKRRRASHQHDPVALPDITPKRKAKHAFDLVKSKG